MKYYLPDSQDLVDPSFVVLFRERRWIPNFTKSFKIDPFDEIGRLDVHACDKSYVAHNVCWLGFWVRLSVRDE